MFTQGDVWKMRNMYMSIYEIQLVFMGVFNYCILQL